VLLHVRHALAFLHVSSFSITFEKASFPLSLFELLLSQATLPKAAGWQRATAVGVEIC
jgi:hypothetical protein